RSTAYRLHTSAGRRTQTAVMTTAVRPPLEIRMSDIPPKEPTRMIEIKPYPYYVAYTEEGTVRVDVRKSPQLIGQTTSRGTRGYNQDRAEYRPLRIPGMVADRKDKTSAQIMYLGVYDG
ncbi:hypothetical protein EC988_008380, partial [Linderina pennispora]